MTGLSQNEQNTAISKYFTKHVQTQWKYFTRGCMDNWRSGDFSLKSLVHNRRIDFDALDLHEINRV